VSSTSLFSKRLIDVLNVAQSSGTGSGLERQGDDYDSSTRSGGSRFGGAATSGTGFGNKSNIGMGNETSLPSDYGTDNRQGSQLGGSSDPYSGSSEVGSGYSGGAGFGNKSSSHEPSSGSGYGGNSDLSRSSDPYSGRNEYDSGSPGGVGYGNKSSHSDDNPSGGGKSDPSPLPLRSLLMLFFEDSKAGKFMEKMGGMMGNQKMEQKGMEKREQAGYGEGQSSDY